VQFGEMDSDYLALALTLALALCRRRFDFTVLIDFYERAFWAAEKRTHF
jgi:hypothetical protein